jgi:segregation and condensation protein A
LLRNIVADLEPIDSIRCFFAILFLARDQKVELEQIDEDIKITMANKEITGLGTTEVVK